MVKYRTRNFHLSVRISPRSFASDLQQVTNLLWAQTNSASYPQRDGKRIRGRLSEGPLWMHWWYACGLHRWSIVALDSRIMRCGIVSSWQSDATSEIVKRCWSRVYMHVGLSSAIASDTTESEMSMLNKKKHTERI